MFAQPARSPRYDDNDTEHYARAPQHKNVLTNPVKGHGLKFTEVLLDQVLERYSGIDTEVWAKVSQQKIQKSFLSHLLPEIVNCNTFTVTKCKTCINLQDLLTYLAYTWRDLFILLHVF